MTQRRPADDIDAVDEVEYDPYADEYAAMIAQREVGATIDPALTALLAEIDASGAVAGLRALDAACGEGYLARKLAQRGAQVTGMDLSPRLIALAQARLAADAAHGADTPLITYRVTDLSQPPAPEQVGRYDLAASHLALNDIANYQGFFATVAALVRPGGRFILSLNNPYSFVVRSHIRDYFATDDPHLYRGLAELGVPVHFRHRTLTQYLDAALAVGWRLRRLIDVPTPEGSFTRRPDTLIPSDYSFPMFMILSLERV